MSRTWDDEFFGKATPILIGCLTCPACNEPRLRTDGRSQGKLRIKCKRCLTTFYSNHQAFLGTFQKEISALKARDPEFFSMYKDEAPSKKPIKKRTSRDSVKEAISGIPSSSNSEFSDSDTDFSPPPSPQLTQHTPPIQRLHALSQKKRAKKTGKKRRKTTP